MGSTHGIPTTGQHRLRRTKLFPVRSPVLPSLSTWNIETHRRDLFWTSPPTLLNRVPAQARPVVCPGFSSLSLWLNISPGANTADPQKSHVAITRDLPDPPRLDISAAVSASQVERESPTTPSAREPPSVQSSTRITTVEN
jgi:hypothetical protein